MKYRVQLELDRKDQDAINVHTLNIGQKYDVE